MDPLQFDGYTSYSDSSAPRTPSPNALEDVAAIHHYKEDGPEYWNGTRGSTSLLQDLYEQQDSSYSTECWQQQHARPEYHMIRRATFPYVRQDREEQQYAPYMHPSPYAEYYPEDSPVMMPSQSPPSFSCSSTKSRNDVW